MKLRTFVFNDEHGNSRTSKTRAQAQMAKGETPHR